MLGKLSEATRWSKSPKRVNPMRHNMRTSAKSTSASVVGLHPSIGQPSLRFTPKFIQETLPQSHGNRKVARKVAGLFLYSTSLAPFGYFLSGNLSSPRNIGVMNFHEAMISSVDANNVWSPTKASWMSLS